MQFDPIFFSLIWVVFKFYMPHYSCYLQGNFTGKASEIGMEVLKAFSFYIVYFKKNVQASLWWNGCQELSIVGYQWNYNYWASIQQIYKNALNFEV